MPHPIVVWPDKALDNPTQPVTGFGPPLEALLAQMHEAVVAAEGVGIAANQIGVPLKVALVGRDDGTFFEIVNPEVVSTAEPITLREGCLSVPEQWHQVQRFKRVSVKYQDKTGAWHQMDAEERLAHVFQHEIDHLNGQVYVMRLSSLKRQLIRDAMKKWKAGR